MKNLNKTNVRSFALQLCMGLSACVVWYAAPTLADIDLSTARKLSASGQILTLEKIIEKAKAVKSGKVLEAELENKSNRYVYEVELLDNQGVVWEIKLDAKTGRLIELEED